MSGNRDERFRREAFWNRTIQVKADVCGDKYFSLFKIKSEVDKIYSLSLENNMERVIEEWRQLPIFVNVPAANDSQCELSQFYASSNASSSAWANNWPSIM